jgi:hypothetical protein
METRLKQAEVNLQEALIMVQVSEVLFQLVQQYQELSQQLQLETRALNHRRAESELRTARIARQTEQCREETLQSQIEMKALEREYAELIEEDNRYNSQTQALKVEQDITLLPQLVLRNVASFLHYTDLAASLGVCSRWQHTLKKGFIAKVLCVIVLDKWSKARKQYQHQLTRTETYLRDAPKTVTISVQNATDAYIAMQGAKAKTMKKPKKGGLSKGQMFAVCMQKVDEKTARARGERDDLVTFCNFERFV